MSVTRMRRLHPDEIDSTDPKDIAFALSEFPIQVGLTHHEVLIELQSGRLVAQGIVTQGGYDDVSISLDAFVEWVASGSPLALKAWAFVNRPIETSS